MKKREHRLFIRVTDEERNRILDKMYGMGIHSLSAYIRKMAVDGYVVRLDLSDVNEVARLLHINSNNLNQYAKQANTNGSIYYGDIQNLKHQHEELCNLLKAIYQRLLTI